MDYNCDAHWVTPSYSMIELMEETIKVGQILSAQ